MKIVLQREKQMNFENKKSGFVKTSDELVNSPLKDQTNRQPSLTVEEIKTGIFSTDFKNPPIQAPPGGRMWSTIFRSSLLRRN